jgi:hypothetical protein
MRGSWRDPAPLFSFFAMTRFERQIIACIGWGGCAVGITHRCNEASESRPFELTHMEWIDSGSNAYAIAGAMGDFRTRFEVWVASGRFKAVAPFFTRLPAVLRAN